MERLKKFAWMCVLSCLVVGLVGCLERKSDQEQQTPWQKKWNKRLDLWDKESKKLHKELNRLEAQLKALQGRQKRAKKPKGSHTVPARRRKRLSVRRAPVQVTPRRKAALPIVTRRPLPRPREVRRAPAPVRPVVRPNPVPAVRRSAAPAVRRPVAPSARRPAGPAPSRAAVRRAPANRAAPVRRTAATSRPAPAAIKPPTSQKAPAARKAAPASRPAQRQPAPVRAVARPRPQPAARAKAAAPKAEPPKAAPRRPAPRAVTRRRPAPRPAAVVKRKAAPRARPAARARIMRLTPIDLVKRRIKYVKNLIKWFTIGKVEMGKLRLLKPGLTRASTYSKDGKRTAGVWEYATKARYGLLSDYDWRDGDKSMTAYYLRKFIVLVVTFSKDQKMVDATLTRCRRPGSGQISDLRSQAGIDWPVVQAIHRSPSIDGWSWHPGGVVIQVNQLRQMGTQKILQGMSRYLRLARQYRLCRHRYDIDEKRILPLLRLLFVRKKGAPKALPWKIGVPDVILPKGNNDFPLFPLALSAQQPLLLINGYFRGGQPVGGLQAYIDDVRKHGVLRSSDLKPKASVAQAVDALVKTAAWKGLMSAKAQNRAGSWKRPARKINEEAFRTYHKVLLRAQALRAANPWPSTAQKKAINKRSKLAQSTFAKLRSDADWKQLLKTASK